ncbi:acyl-protein synthetase [Aeromonas hydrophila]|uniref:LuxE/PaaK family acyltransferase n=1 Tax=Aeromonas hydrophila TaxID=644 RepID=UPI000666D08C|nr:acyl-protein synthetase [Aeromonas hydrophila]MBM0438246.1 acyl-protein synthetase [Aeromonas hydrophila subsp. ranae]MBW3828981.1 acyl-protein synthetase [Aeromonas hydrophila]MDE8807914.1 acyl-protein synthetase [Aeromonas hydrophila]UUM73164.1 acyl-protein synthetase [Aeromonas hydrophila]
MEHLLSAPVFALPQAAKQALLLARLNALTAHHRAHCTAYDNVLQAFGWTAAATDYDALPYLAARLFKLAQWQSVPQSEVFKVLTSSGTTGSPSRIVLDRETAALQSKVLVKILQEFVGKQRLPMLLVEQPALIQNRSGFSARGAGALGLSFLGRDHTYALDEQMRPNWPVIEAFCDKYAGQPVLLFGFTFMVWQCLLEPLRERGLQLPLTQGILFHSGGWKKLQHLAVDNPAFKARCREQLGLGRVHNFYGMVEQVGSIFVECEQGHLHAPVFADVQVRDPLTHQPLGIGSPGLLQVLSAIPGSYPGHSLLSEDLGVLLGEDDCPCGRHGRYFHVAGRQHGAEVRGCSDTFQ